MSCQHLIVLCFRAISFIGLGLIALGTGGIKPCVVSFGAEQFVLPEQENYMKSYFSFFYASINAGSLISTILTPLLRESGDGCAGQEKCYPAAFGVPAGLMFVAISKSCEKSNCSLL
jgi:solute carrier family 15 oligopeptide transporter 1